MTSLLLHLNAIGAILIMASCEMPAEHLHFHLTVPLWAAMHFSATGIWRCHARLLQLHRVRVPTMQQEDRHARRALKHVDPGQLGQPGQVAMDSNAAEQQLAQEVLLFDLVRMCTCVCSFQFILQHYRADLVRLSVTVSAVCCTPPQAMNVSPQRNQVQHHAMAKFRLQSLELGRLRFLQVYDDGSKLDRATAGRLPRDTLN